MGTAVVEYLLNHYDDSKSGVKINLKKVVVANGTKRRTLRLKSQMVSTDHEAILHDKEIDIVVELIGGIEPAKSIVIEALRGGKGVVTANKAILAAHSTEILSEARKSGSPLGFQASVCGEMRVLDQLREIPSHKDLRQVVGIVNGSSNYVLSAMENGLTYSSAVKQAKKRGITERPESFDLEGIDAANKLSIIASIGFGIEAKYHDIYREGITQVTQSDISYAKSLGYTIKPIAVARRGRGSVELRVHPSLVPVDHPLSSVREENNAVSIYLEGRDAPRTMIGKGAGKPTALSIVSDIIDAAKNMRSQWPKLPRINSDTSPQKISHDDFITPFYLRFLASNKPGVLSKISGVLGEHGINISKAIQMQPARVGQVASLVLLVDPARNRAVRDAITRIKDLAVVDDILTIPVLE